MILSAKERDSWRGNRDFVSFAVYISVYTLSLQSHLYLLLMGFFVVGFFVCFFLMKPIQKYHYELSFNV